MTGLSSEIEYSLRSYLEGDRSAADRLHMRSNDRGGVLRLSVGARTSIVKIWKIRNLKEKLKSTLRLSNGCREWRIHRMIYQAGIQTPEPLCYQRLTTNNGQNYELMVLQDLGETESGLPFLKRMIQSGNYGAATAFEEAVIGITSRMLDLRILDVDNQINNFLVHSSGHIARIDFECARKRNIAIFWRPEYVTMLDRLIRSHLHATYPESERTSHFITRFAKRLNVSTYTLNRVVRMTTIKLRQEKKKTGIDYSLKIDW